MGNEIVYHTAHHQPEYFYDVATKDYQIHHTYFDARGEKHVRVQHFGSVMPPGFPRNFRIHQVQAQTLRTNQPYGKPVPHLVTTPSLIQTQKVTTTTTTIKPSLDASSNYSSPLHTVNPNVPSHGRLVSPTYTPTAIPHHAQKQKQPLASPTYTPTTTPTTAPTLAPHFAPLSPSELQPPQFSQSQLYSLSSAPTTSASSTTLNASEKNNPFSAAYHPISSQSQMISTPSDANANLSLLQYNSSLDLNNTATPDDLQKQKIQQLQDQFRFNDSTSIDPSRLSPTHVNALLPSSLNNSIAVDLPASESEANKSPTATLLFGAGQVLKSPTGNTDEQAKLLQQLQNMKREQEQHLQREREQQLRDEKERERIEMQRRLEEEREREMNERFLREEAEKQRMRQQQLLQQQQSLQQLEREQQERERLAAQKLSAPLMFVPSQQEIEDMNKTIKKEEASKKTAGEDEPFVRIVTIKNQPQAQVPVIDPEEDKRARLNLDMLKFGASEPKAKGFDAYDEL